MRRLTRNAPRTCVALVLILTLVGLGALDAAVCRGADGHRGIETRLSSCCRSTAPGICSADLVDGNQTSALDPACGGSTCEDIPLIHGIPTSNADDLVVDCLGQAITIPWPLVVSPTDREAAPAFGPGSILCRLRTTTLLI